VRVRCTGLIGDSYGFFQKTGAPPKFDEQLTPQEVRLLKLLAEGYSYQSAGEQLNISLNTVRNYIRSTY